MDKIDLTNKTNLDLSLLDNLSPAEKELALSILKEYSTKGESDKLKELLLDDYREVPVDILTFVDDNNYLGYAWHDAEGKSKLYPYWRKELLKIFPDNLTITVNNAILSGSRGRGKTEIAILIAAYLLYRILCLKNPIEYFYLKPTEKLVFAFMNIKLDLAEEIGVAKFQNTIQSSPWFLSHGTLEGRTKKIWVPEKFNGQEVIDIKIGSQADDLIGLPIYFCLDGDTIITTADGDYKIKTLENKPIQVLNYTDSNELCLSDTCTVKKTATSNIEYEIELEDGSILKCTPNHRFLLINGQYKEAQYLTEDDELLDFAPYGYVYKTTNLINNKIYIGQKKGIKFLNDKYLGSGKLLKSSILKYGKDNFKVELIEFCKNKADLDKKEIYWINKYNSSDLSIGYNIASGGQGGNLGEAVAEKISEALVGRVKTKEQKAKISATLKNKGLKLTDEQKAIISKANKNKQVSAETRYKQSEAAKKVDRSNRIAPNKHSICITDGINIKYIKKEEIIPNGWYKGNCKTQGEHSMKNYTDAMRIHRQNISQGKHNNNYGKGYKQSGRNNGRAMRHIYNGISFGCREELFDYLIHNGYHDITKTQLASLVRNNFSKKTAALFPELIDKIKIEGYTNEN